MLDNLAAGVAAEEHHGEYPTLPAASTPRATAWRGAPAGAARAPRTPARPGRGRPGAGPSAEPGAGRARSAGRDRARTAVRDAGRGNPAPRD
ncbi:MAG: hypothetical protein HY775_08460 [Acidobacteria bacterium]|nr:hypothetical protein [Acidobacteriota bacterium]